jgi:hypothetical protein
MYRSIRVAGFATLLLTVGCSVGPRYRSPQQWISQFEASPELTISDSVDPRWWQQLDDPVLDSVIHASLKSNNDITISLARLQEARSVFDERKLDRYPLAPVDASYSYAREQVPGFYDKPATINSCRSGIRCGLVSHHRCTRPNHRNRSLMPAGLEETGCARQIQSAALTRVRPLKFKLRHYPATSSLAQTSVQGYILRPK